MGGSKSLLCVKFRRHDKIFVENTSGRDDYRKNKNKNYRNSYMLFTPTLEDLKNVLSTALSPFFEEFEIEVVSCPNLTGAPYKLAAAGLSGNTGILDVGILSNFCSKEHTKKTYDIQDMFSRCSYDAFVIGSGFAAKPALPSNGHLTMSAVVSTNPTNVINNSCIVNEDVLTGRPRLVDINHPNQIKCSLVGQFFFSEGKRGPVIKMRAKGRRSRSNIMTLIQAALTNRYRYEQLIGLGLVLVVNGGLTEQRFLPDDFLSYAYNEPKDYYDRLNKYPMNCKNLIVLGALISERLTIFEDNEKVLLRDDYSMFNALFNFESLGNFANDLTPEETEYIVYMNIAQERCYIH